MEYVIIILLDKYNIGKITYFYNVSNLCNN